MIAPIGEPAGARECEYDALMTRCPETMLGAKTISGQRPQAHVG